MSFTITKTTSPILVYPGLGNLQVPQEASSLSVTYTAEDVVAVSNGKAWVQYSITAEGISGNGSGVVECDFTDFSTVLSNAETVLKEQVSE